MPVVQTLAGRYVDGAALLRLLKELFGVGSFRIDVCLLRSQMTDWRDGADLLPSPAY